MLDRINQELYWLVTGRCIPVSQSSFISTFASIETNIPFKERSSPVLIAQNLSLGDGDAS
jgi:hypothetical protein